MSETAKRTEKAAGVLVVHYENTGVSVPAAGNTTIAEIGVEGCETLSVQFSVATFALDAFTVQRRTTANAAYETEASSAANYTAPTGRIQRASGDLTTVGAGSTGSFDMDVAGLESVKITASGNGGAASVSVYATATKGKGSGSQSALSSVLGATADAAVSSDAVGTISGKLRGIVKILADLWDSTLHRLKVSAKVDAATPTSYRTNVTSADLLAAPAQPTCTLVAGGSLAASAHTIFVVGGNVYGRTTATQGNATVTGDGGANKTARVAITQLAGATFYDIYCSTDGAASKWVGRITEAQRATGIKITAVGVTGAGGTAGAVDVEVPGTGLAVNGGQLTQNTAYSIPASPVDCSGYQYVDFDLTMSRTGDAAAPSLKVIPFWYNSRTSTYQSGDVQSINFGGQSGAYWPNKQRLRLECRGNSAVALAVASIAGTGASLDIDAALS